LNPRLFGCYERTIKGKSQSQARAKEKRGDEFGASTGFTINIPNTLEEICGRFFDLFA